MKRTPDHAREEAAQRLVKHAADTYETAQNKAIFTEVLNRILTNVGARIRFVLGEEKSSELREEDLVAIVSDPECERWGSILDNPAIKKNWLWIDSPFQARRSRTVRGRHTR